MGSYGDLIREWDRAVQDALARLDDHHANAYLLGRGLAECYWGHRTSIDLDP